MFYLIESNIRIRQRQIGGTKNEKLILALTVIAKDCSSGILGPRSHNLVPQCLLLKLTFSLLQLEPLFSDLQQAINPCHSKRSIYPALTSSCASHLPFRLSSSACPLIFSSPPDDPITGEGDVSISSFCLLFSGVLERDRDSEGLYLVASFPLLGRCRSSLRLLLLLRGGGSGGLGGGVLE